MQFEISSNRIEIRRQLRAQIEVQLDQAFQRLGRWISRVSICLDDINGPRGGVCKQCRLVVTTNGVPSIVITETDEKIGASIGTAIQRARYALKQRVKATQSRQIKRAKQRRNAERFTDSDYAVDDERESDV